MTGARDSRCEPASPISHQREVGWRNSRNRVCCPATSSSSSGMRWRRSFTGCACAGGCCSTTSNFSVPRRCAACGRASRRRGRWRRWSPSRTTAPSRGGQETCRALGNMDPVRWESELPLAPLPHVSSLEIDRIRTLLDSTKRVEDDVSLRRQIVWVRLQAVRAEVSRRFDDVDLLVESCVSMRSWALPRARIEGGRDGDHRFVDHPLCAAV